MKTFATILFVAASSLAGAQTARPDTIYLVTVSYGDSVVLRWAPGSAHLWKVAARNGYRIERKKLGERDYRVVTNSPLKPYSLSEWKRRTDTTNVHVATAAQVMLGTVMMKPQEAVSFSQKLLASEEERNRLALALYCAEFSIQAGNGLAFRWVDRDIERDASYYYRVSVVPEPNPVTVVPGVAKQKVADTYKPTPVMDVVAEGRDGEIEIRWDKGDNDRKFSGYFVERSEDGKTFNALNEVPFKTIEDERLGTEHVYVDQVTGYGKVYHYRVRGITSFADYGAYSEIVKAETRDLNAPAPPSVIRVESLDEKRVKVTWTDNPVAPDHAGYFIGRGRSIHGPFEKLNTAPLNTSVREYVDEGAIPHGPNFYTVIAVDRSGNENMSVVGMAVLKDYTPPVPPRNLIGDIDTLGIVSLAWELGSDEDLMGYRVYRADHPDAEYIQVTNAPIPGNFYMDTISLKTLTRKVYYKVAAFDFNYNPSEFSDVLELERPDYVPPVKPIIHGYSVLQDTIEINYVPSHSNDVAKHLLFRKEGTAEWQLVALVDTTGIYRDVSIDPAKTYAYALEAIDHSGLVSGKTQPIVVTSSLPTRPPVQNFNGVFDKTSKGFALSWDYNEPGEYKFVIYRGLEGSALHSYASVKGTARTFVDNKFYRNGQGYVYALKVLFSDGTESAFSQQVNVVFEQ
ncbi:MAG: hypothetical protein LOY03_04030 [Cyclobacteriaceae bacterium]|nr:hypothetical protein [Cyclobacteriaceae bacterium]